MSKDEANKLRRALDLFKIEDKMPMHYISFIRDGIYEFRVTHCSNEFRIFFIYDGDTIVVLFNAFKKRHVKHQIMK
ncbi:MAG: type II toxin-antitoxin system RelE/ParE family toxin [Bacteroidales bacterium]|nr:type II toxin-antitoxin system RelE/ParE family toxin [Bacteroidales bacterium]